MLLLGCCPLAGKANRQMIPPAAGTRPSAGSWSAC